jgi:hypothetical protein
MLKDVVYDSKSKAITHCTLIMGQNTVASKVVAILGSRFPSVFEKEPPHPLLDGIKDHMRCALFVIALGYNALPGGVDNMCPSTLHKLLATLFGDQFIATTPPSTQTDAKKMKVGKLAQPKGAHVTCPLALLSIAKSILFKPTSSDKCYM